jgi:hypothetical protein
MKRPFKSVTIPVGNVSGKAQVYKNIECALDRLSIKTVRNLEELEDFKGIEWKEVYFFPIERKAICWEKGRRRVTSKIFKRHTVVVRGVKRHWFRPNEEFFYVRRETRCPSAGSTKLYRNGRLLGRITYILQDMIEHPLFTLVDNSGPVYKSSETSITFGDSK